MKKFLHILIALFSVIIVILGLAFAFIEARLIFSLDWLTYQFAFNGFLRYFLRLIISLFAIFVATLYFIKYKKNSTKCDFIFNLCLSQLAICSVVILILGSNYVNVAIFVIALIYLILNAVNHLLNKNN